MLLLDSSSPHSEGMLNPALTLEENPGVRNFPLDVSLLPTDSLSNGDIVQTQNSGEIDSWQVCFYESNTFLYIIFFNILSYTKCLIFSIEYKTGSS